MSEWKVEISGFADEIASDLNQQIALLQDLDMHYLEMRGVNGRFLVEYTLEEAAEIKKTLDAAGIRSVFESGSVSTLLNGLPEDMRPRNIYA